MPKNKRIIQRKAQSMYPRPRSLASRLTLSFTVALGMAVMGFAFFFHVLYPNETQSSVDRTAWELTEGKIFSFGEEESQPDPCSSDSANSEEELPEAQAPAEPTITRMTDLIKSGDSPSTLLEGHLRLAEIYSLCDESKKTYSLSKLKAGQPWTMIYSDNALVGLEYEIDDTERLVVSMTEDGYEFRREAIPYDIETETVSGVIENSLFRAVQVAGESDELALRLANVFAYDVDFVRDLRTGDNFKVVIEKRSREGKLIGYGHMLAASFTNNGQTYYAYRFTDKQGNTAYYNHEGRPLRKAFLKAPLSFTRISSGYSMSRLHPILKYRRPHQGIDYAAPTGTPIYTVADGVIAEAAFNNSQGRFVRVIHSNGYETIYNHMSKFAANSKKGAKVKQGQTIGYVGSTGYATGPHLDFRMKKNGALINPLSLKTLPAEPIAAKEMPAFKAFVASFKPRLESLDTASLETVPTQH
ncbi:MAG: peptidoglycan DD-metalloendopeptidase family protein [Desulfovibrionales bacterium]|nr:peptidoglycan DD-metalloendopeptidase family protein [Desulfovibrionales bacterium]